MSDQYTPTTDEVRDEFIYGHQEVDMDTYELLVSFDEAQARWERWLASVKAEAWDEGNLAAYPLQLAVGQFIDNGGDAWGNLDDAYEQVSAASNPYREQGVT